MAQDWGVFFRLIKTNWEGKTKKTSPVAALLEQIITLRMTSPPPPMEGQASPQVLGFPIICKTKSVKHAAALTDVTHISCLITVQLAVPTESQLLVTQFRRTCCENNSHRLCTFLSEGNIVAQIMQTVPTYSVRQLWPQEVLRGISA